MLIARNTVVTLKYSVKDSDGAAVDAGEEPLIYLHGGYGGIFDRIEEELQGKAEGAVLAVKLEPEEAFGEYDAELVAIEPRQLFPDNIQVGMQFERGSEDGEEEDGLFVITDIADDKVVVDGNHPLAGMALLFSCTVTGVRAATKEEITHGHVHGAHGHQH
jgi:FKBP-type peptidyl-prolyl cis-trans isomerase SlyD